MLIARVYAPSAVRTTTTPTATASTSPLMPAGPRWRGCASPTATTTDLEQFDGCPEAKEVPRAHAPPQGPVAAHPSAGRRDVLALQVAAEAAHRVRHVRPLRR